MNTVIMDHWVNLDFCLTILKVLKEYLVKYSNKAPTNFCL